MKLSDDVKPYVCVETGTEYADQTLAAIFSAEQITWVCSSTGIDAI
jgi:hypothetical protein